MRHKNTTFDPLLETAQSKKIWYLKDQRTVVMTGPPEHRKEPQKVTTRRRKLLPQDTINRHLPEQNNPVVNSNEIIMVMKRPVAAEDHLRLRANLIAAGPVLTTGRKEVMVANRLVKRKVIHPKEKVVIRTGQTLMTGTKAVLVVVKRKVSNQGVPLIPAARHMMISLREISMVNHPGKKGPM
jgi:hypothetical protein